jgi:hypothetical protein
MAVLAVLLVTGLGYAAFTGHARATFLILLVGSAVAFLLAVAAIETNFRGAGDFFEKRRLLGDRRTHVQRRLLRPHRLRGRAGRAPRSLV